MNSVLSRSGMAALVVMATVAIRSVVAGCNKYEDSPRPATIGERMVLPCTLARNETCFSTRYEWYRIDGLNERILLPEEMNSELVVSEDVTSAAEVGGRVYECYCFNTTSCRRFKIGVTPVAHLSTSASNNVAKSGSSVNVICTAESYPPADSVSDYLIKHPRNTSIDKHLLPEMDGVVHRIVAATKERDAGKYECSVNVTLDVYPGKPLDSNVAIVNLRVYDAPSIVSVRNFTVYPDIDVEQSAILECAVSNTEDNLKVWVNWTTIDGKEIKKEHVTLRKGDVFYLLLYNATAADYMCQLFSTYSPNDVEDKKVVAVVFSESPTTTIGGLTPKTEKSDYTFVGVIILSFIVVVLGIVLIVLVVIFYRRWKKYKPNRHMRSPDANRGRDNDYEHSDPSRGRISEDGSYGNDTNDGEYFSNKTVADDPRSVTAKPLPSTNPQLSGSTPPDSGVRERTSDSFGQPYATAVAEGQSVLPSQSTEVPGLQGVSFTNEANDERETHTSSPVSAKSLHSATPEKFTDSPPTSPRYRKMSLTRRFSDTFRRSSTTSVSLEETQVLLHDEIPEDSHTAEAPLKKELGAVSDETSEWEEYDSSRERKDSIPAAVTLPRNPSHKKLSLTRRASASQSFKRSSISSIGSTSEAEKSTPKTKLAVVYKAEPKVDDDM